MKIPLPTHTTDGPVVIEQVGVSSEEYIRVQSFLNMPSRKCTVCGCFNHPLNRGCAYCINRRGLRNPQSHPIDP